MKGLQRNGVWQVDLGRCSYWDHLCGGGHRLDNRNSEGMVVMETWDEMKARHKRERIEALEALNQSGYTQTQAAKILQMSHRSVNRWAQIYEINWKVKYKGQNNDRQSTS